MIKFENRNKMDVSENSLNGQTLDDEQHTRSLEDSGIYSIEELQQQAGASASSNQWQPESLASLGDSGIAKEDGQTDIGSASGEMLVKNTRDDYEENEISNHDGASTAQKPVQDTQVPGLHTHINDQDLVGFYAQLQRTSVWIAEAKNDIARYLQDGTGNVDLSQAFQVGNRVFNETVALKRNGEELMNKFQLNSTGQGKIMKETTPFETPETKMQTELVTAKSLPTYHPQNGDHALTTPLTQDLLNVHVAVPTETQTNGDITMTPVDEVHQHTADTPGMLESMYTSGTNADLYQEPSSETTSNSADPAPPVPTENGNAELHNSRRLSVSREHKEIELKLVAQLLPVSNSVGIIVKEYYAQGTAGEGINPPELSCIRHSWGTCFRLGSKYVLTNKHVADMAELAHTTSNAYVVFDYYQKPLPFSHFPIRSIRFSCIDPNLDYSVLELDIPDSQFQTVQENLPGLGHLVKKLGKAQKVTLIGHPDGQPLSMDPSCPVLSPLNMNDFAIVNKIGTSQALILHHPERVLYRSTFWHGSSGSPAFDDNVHLVGMHTRGFPTDGPFQVEQMIRMTAIRAEVRLHQPDLCDDLFFSQPYMYQPP